MQDQNIPWKGNVNADLPKPIDVEPAIAGSGGDDHTYAVARSIAELTADFDLYSSWMQEWNQRCIPPWDQYRLAHNIRKGWNAIHGHDGFYLPPPDVIPHVRKSRVALRRLDELAFTAKGKFGELLAFLKPKRKAIPTSEAIIDRLYPGNPLICRAAGGEWWARTAPRESIRGVEHEFEWIVPSPMSKVTGYTKTGRPGSHRCRDNSGPRIYIVIEFDYGKTFKKRIEAWAAEGISTRDVQAMLILWLATTGEPRAWPFMIVDTGGKSLHSWYQISKRFSEQNALDLLARAIPFGADPRADQPEQFFRFPGGTRKSDRCQPQPVLFYDTSKLV